MRSHCIRWGVLLLLGVALAGCAFAPPPEPVPEIATPAEPTLGMASEMQAPSDLDGAVMLAQTHRRNGDYGAATRVLGQLILVAPDDPRVLAEYGKTLLAMGENADALLFLSRAIELQPMDWTLYSALGVAQDQRGDYGQARQAYERALALMPEEPTVLSNAGLSRLSAGDLEGAEAYLQRAVAVAPEDARIQQNLARVQEQRRQLAARASGPEGTRSDAPWGLGWPWDAPAEGQGGVAALANDPSVVMAPIPEPEEAAPPAPETVPVPLQAESQGRRRIYSLPRALAEQSSSTDPHAVAAGTAEENARIAEGRPLGPPPSLRRAE